MTLAVGALTEEWHERYEAFVREHPFGLVYYSLRFRDFLTALLRCEARYAIAVHGEQVVGVLPLMVRDGPYGLVMNSLPYFGSNGGILSSGSASAAALCRWYEAQVTAPGVAAATVTANPADPDPPAVIHDLEDVRVGSITTFEGSGPAESIVEQAIGRSARRDIAAARNKGVQVEIENESFPALVELHRQNMAAVGAPVKTPAFFQSVQERFAPGSDYNLYVARSDGEVAAALLLFYFGATVEYYVPAIALDYRPLLPMAAILQRAMTDAVGSGFRHWNWGGSSPSQEGLLWFKSKWGGRQRRYCYWTKVNQPQLFSSTADELLRSYSYFYVLPFSELAGRGG